MDERTLLTETWAQIVQEESSGTLQPGRTYRGTFGIADAFHQEWASTQSIGEVTASADSQAEDASKTPFDGYLLVGELGRGGMGIVHRAKQSRMRRTVALKQSISDAGIEMFKNEALVTGALEHPNIVTVYDLLVSERGGAGMVMKLVKGHSWEEILRKDWRDTERLPEERTLYHLEILRKVCQAVAYAHSKDILHNDLKAENVMVGDYGEVAVMDWGCATTCAGFEGQHELPVIAAERVSKPFGTPNCMAPEQAKGAGYQLHQWTDTYLLGAALYRILEGRQLRRGTGLKEMISRAADGEYDEMKRCRSGQLRAMCTKALHPNPAERYTDVNEFLEGLNNYQRTRESEKLAGVAQSQLEATMARVQQSSGLDQRVLVDLGAAVYGFQQALVLWPENQEARNGATDARMTLIECAVQSGDLGLAGALVDQLDLAEKREYCDGLVSDAVAARERAEARAKQTRLLASLAVGAVLVVMLVAGTFIFRAREHAEDQLADIQGLSDNLLVQKLDERDDKLWPATPPLVDDMTDWIDEARGVVAKLPGHRAHFAELKRQVALMDSVSELPDVSADALEFRDPEVEWEYRTLEELIHGVERLESERLAAMEERRTVALSLRSRSEDAYRDAWNEAIAAIKVHPKYQGLVLPYQLGLVPLGPDAESGLWEFAHLPSGEVPARDSDGRLQYSEDSSIVLVLIPPGTFKMGAQSRNPSAPNYDPRATDLEGPVHDVSLRAFFMAKHELTQAQWLRVMPDNPSAYRPGRAVGKLEPQIISALHPVEQITWSDAAEVARRLDLVLPTEAQWEYAHRAGTTTVYWSGEDVSDLGGTLNIADRFCLENGGPGSWKYEESLSDGHLAHAPVGEFRANPFGLHDTAGNVWEWCADRFAAYSQPVAPEHGAREPSDSAAARVFRGGGFRASSIHARSADRYQLYSPDYKGYDVGVRLARPVRR